MLLRLVCSALATVAGAACFSAAIWIVVPSPNGYLEILAVRFTEHSLQLTLVSIGSLCLVLVACRFAGSLRWCMPGLVLSLVACGISLLPTIQAAQLAARYGTGLDPLRTLRPAQLAGLAPTTIIYETIDGQTLAADVYRSYAGATRAPVVIAVHGGGWSDGARTDYLPWHEWLAQQGFVVVAIDYRLRPQPNWPAAAFDVQHAVDWVQRNADALGADPERVALVGRSAGGQLALLAAYARGAPAGLSPVGRPVQAVVALYAPTDLVWGFDHPANERVYDVQSSLRAFLGGDPTSVPDRYHAASPSNYVRPGVRLPPTLLVHGGHDQLVPTRQMYLLADELRRADVRAETVEIPYAQHAFDLPFEGWSSQLVELLLLRFLTETLRAV
jgi:acetyl esterase/lipase